jgi:ectoine hydroxylase-related dioxygenase (phytanoyl-CoA dioxygenase family)
MLSSATTDSAETYHEKGYLVLRGVFSGEEVAALQAECEWLLGSDFVQPHNPRTPFRFNSGDAPERIDPVVDISPLFQKFTADARIVEPLRAIFDDEPLLFKDKLILKLPGTHGYTMHQDQAWWQLCPADDILSVLITIDGADAANGTLELFPGYHRELRTPAGEKRNMNEDEVAQIDASRGEMIETRPGDVVIFHSQTPHQSGINNSTKPRRSLYLSYSAARNGDLHATYYEQYAKQFGKETADVFKTAC